MLSALACAPSSRLYRLLHLLQGRACNMTKPAQVASLADFAHDELGSIDLWCVLCPVCEILVFVVQYKLTAEFFPQIAGWLA